MRRHLISHIAILAVGLTGSVLFWIAGMGVVADIAAQTSMTSDQQFFIAVLTVVVPGIGLVAVAAVPAWFARRATKSSEFAAAKAVEAVENSAIAVKKTEVLTETTAEMAGRMNGQLERLMKLVEEAALLKGAEQERIRADAQKVTDAATVRENAKEDRAEGREAMVPQASQPVIPVETRTEAAEAQEPKAPN